MASSAPPPQTDWWVNLVGAGGAALGAIVIAIGTAVGTILRSFSIRRKAEAEEPQKTNGSELARALGRQVITVSEREAATLKELLDDERVEHKQDVEELKRRIAELEEQVKALVRGDVGK